MLARPYEMPWRRAYEAYASLIWYLAFGLVLHQAWQQEMPWAMAGPMALACLLSAVRRSAQALRVLVVRASLSGRAMQAIRPAQIEQLTHDPERIYLGQGFEWQPVHSQRLYELAKVDYREHLVSPAVAAATAVAGHLAAPADL